MQTCDHKPFTTISNLLPTQTQSLATRCELNLSTRFTDICDMEFMEVQLVSRTHAAAGRQHFAPLSLMGRARGGVRLAARGQTRKGERSSGQ